MPPFYRGSTPAPGGSKGHATSYGMFGPTYSRHSTKDRFRFAIKQRRAAHDSKPTSHSRMVLSQLAEARILPSGLKATLGTFRSCPCNGWAKGRRLAMSHNLTTPVAAPYGLKPVVWAKGDVKCTVLPLHGYIECHSLRDIPKTHAVRACWR